MSTTKATINSAHINWDCEGKFNFTTGFGATKAESIIANYAALIAPVILYFFSWHALAWSSLQVVVAALLTLDMIGGVLSNSLGSMKRFLHTDQSLELSWMGKLVGSKFLFPSVHFQLFAVPLCFDIGWSYAFIWYGVMMSAIVFLHAMPMYLHRPIALIVVMISIILATLLASPVGLEWLAPIFIIKLVLSHGVREEPYRPTLSD
uniref:hypothetical protein n=1 Tax=Thaumasiovibrio occultus TaxID=1891184 RepID=UPI001863A2DD|nr:hypothetical protein [Thaumasiovibrio occultus]